MSKLLALMILTLFPGARKAAAQPCRAPNPSEALAAIRTLNEEYIEAARTSDSRWFGAHLAEDVVVVFGNSRRVRKAEFLRLLVEEPKSYRSLAVRDVTGRVLPNA